MISIESRERQPSWTRRRIRHGLEAAKACEEIAELRKEPRQVLMLALGMKARKPSRRTLAQMRRRMRITSDAAFDAAVARFERRIRIKQITADDRDAYVLGRRENRALNRQRGRTT